MAELRIGSKGDWNPGFPLRHSTAFHSRMCKHTTVQVLKKIYIPAHVHAAIHHVRAG